MEYRTLGGSGVKVSHFCLGAMMFGTLGNTDHDECVRITHTALEAGINFIDTSDAYSSGESERILAKALKGRRDEVVLATKCFFPIERVGQFSRPATNVNLGGGSRRWIVRAVENSLQRLETDYIDVYQLHRRDWDTDLEESLAAMTDLQRAGKIRLIGTSATPAEWIVEAQRLAERAQSGPGTQRAVHLLPAQPGQRGRRLPHLSAARRRHDDLRTPGRRLADRQIQARRAAAGQQSGDRPPGTAGGVECRTARGPAQVRFN